MDLNRQRRASLQMAFERGLHLPHVGVEVATWVWVRRIKDGKMKQMKSGDARRFVARGLGVYAEAAKSGT